MQVLIVEDEFVAAERLRLLLHRYDPTIEVVASLESIEDVVAHLNQNPHPDLLILDIHLSDGDSFEIFNRVPISKPVIFTSAYDQYAIDAFRLFSIDYILKPVTLEALGSAINKYRAMSNGFSNIDLSMLVPNLHSMLNKEYKSRFLGKIGTRLFFVESDEIAYFQADNKVVYLVDREGKKYLVDYTLEKLEAVLDPSKFFRLNRRYIVTLTAIQHIRPYYNNRLKLQVKGSAACDEMIISRERVSDFRAWADS